MTRKEYNLNPANLKEAIDIIQVMETDLTNVHAELAQVKQERDDKTQAWQATNDKYQQLLKNQGNSPLTEAELIAQAKKLGMQTKEEYQTALQSNKDTPSQGSADYAGWYALGAVMVIIIGWAWLKSKSKNS